MDGLLETETWVLGATAAMTLIAVILIRFVWRRGKRIGDQ
jgi:hypothetical protein